MHRKATVVVLKSLSVGPQVTYVCCSGMSVYMDIQSVEIMSWLTCKYSENCPRAKRPALRTTWLLSERLRHTVCRTDDSILTHTQTYICNIFSKPQNTLYAPDINVIKLINSPREEIFVCFLMDLLSAYVVSTSFSQHSQAHDAPLSLIGVFTCKAGLCERHLIHKIQHNTLWQRSSLDRAHTALPLQFTTLDISTVFMYIQCVFLRKKLKHSSHHNNRSHCSSHQHLDDLPVVGTVSLGACGVPWCQWSGNT